MICGNGDVIAVLEGGDDFPDPRSAGPEGLLACGGDLSPARIMEAYRRGIFPWYAEGDPILWWSPDPRLVLRPGGMHVSRSLRKRLRRAEYSVKFDRNFSAVIRACAGVPRKRGGGTWLTEEMQAAYIRLHFMGVCHSVEVYAEGTLVGGLYGLAMGGAFFGESMFSLRPDASKTALKALSDVLSEKGYDFIDCQVVSDHLLRLGAEAVSRELFLERLKSALERESDVGSWSDFEWEYRDG